MAEAARIVEDSGADIIDINMGCPVKKVVKTNSGSALLKDIQRAETVLEKIVNAVNLPVSIKIRSGWDKDSINALEISRMAEDLGVSAITIHPRTMKQGFSGKSDWSLIKKIKESINIPVIGNGDIKNPMDAERMIQETG